MKRTRLERRVPIKRSGLSRSHLPTPIPKRTGWLRARSVRRIAEQATRRDLADRELPCELGPAIEPFVPGWWGKRLGCTGWAEHWHERRKASAGGSRVNPDNLIACCDRCNDWLEAEPEMARRVWLLDGRRAVLREGDAGFDRLSKRNDPKGKR